MEGATDPNAFAISERVGRFAGLALSGALGEIGSELGGLFGVGIGFDSDEDTGFTVGVTVGTVAVGGRRGSGEGEGEGPCVLTMREGSGSVTTFGVASVGVETAIFAVLVVVEAAVGCGAMRTASGEIGSSFTEEGIVVVVLVDVANVA